MSYSFKQAPVEQTSSNFSFGLNQNVIVKSLTYIENGTSKSAEVIFEKQGTEFKQRFFEPTTVFGDGDIEKYKQAVANSLFDIVLCFVSEEVLAQRLSNVTDFKSLITTLESILKQSQKFSSKQPVDIFLQYQSKISKNADRTFLEYHSGAFGVYRKSIVPAQEGIYKENKTTELTYVNENGVTHPLKRNSWFLNSKNASIQRITPSKNTVGDAQAFPTTNTEEFPF